MTRRGRHVRPIHLAMILVVGITLVAAPNAAAFHEFVIPAGLGCSFDVQVETVHQEQPGDRFPIGYGDITLTNMDTGASYLQRSRYMGTETFDPETDTGLAKIKGRFFVKFYPGDQGPNGEVAEPGTMLAFSGSLEITFDLDTGLFTAFSYRGTFIDLCAKLAE